MNKLENGHSELEGKLVGRVGVEPTTKRLRAALPNEQSTDKCTESSLIEDLGSASKSPPLRLPIRGIFNGLLILLVLAALIFGAIACWQAPVVPAPTPWASGTECHTDRANPWCGK